MRFFCTVVVLLALLAPAATGQRVLDSEIKATYLLNFAQFVRWPAGSPPEGQPFRICVSGTDPFGPALDSTLANEKVNGHAVVVERAVGVDSLSTCQVLFVSSDTGKRLPTVLRAIASTPILTVSDIPDFTARGGMIQFVTRNNRVRFEVNLTATDVAKLVLSSELSKVAVAVRRP